MAECPCLGAAERLDDERQRVDLPRPVRGGKGADGAAIGCRVADREVVPRVESGGQDEPERRRIEVIVPALHEQFPLDSLIGREQAERLRGIGGIPRKGVDPAEVRIDGPGGRCAVAVDAHFGGPRCRRKLRRVEREDVEGRIAGEGLGIDHPEEPARFEVEVPHCPVLRLARAPTADREHPLCDGTPLLRRKERLELHRPDLEEAVDAEVGAGHCRREEARRRRPERHRTDLDPPDDLVAQAFVVDLDVVVGVEVTVGVVIDEDVHPLADGASGPHADLVLELGKPDPPRAPGVRVVELRLRTALVADPLGADAQRGLALEGKIGILPCNADDAPVLDDRRGCLGGIRRTHSVNRGRPERRPAGDPRRIERRGHRAVEGDDPARRSAEPRRAEGSGLAELQRRQVEPDPGARQRVRHLGGGGGWDERNQRQKGGGDPRQANQSRNPAAGWKDEARI